VSYTRMHDYTHSGYWNTSQHALPGLRWDTTLALHYNQSCNVLLILLSVNCVEGISALGQDALYRHFLFLPYVQMGFEYSFVDKLLIYKAILKPIWTYGIQLWGTTSNWNIEILERFQSKVLRLIVVAPWYVSNSVIRKDLQIPTVKEEISRFRSHYNVRISVHPNELIASFTAAKPKAPASILAPRPGCPILATCINCISCL
jgi:hypothetical protein